ncbi:MAG: radical SAM protein [Elusimicrobia bacterium]|nr:radical SAM protein [Elusimicrobiota bacterium]
MRISLVNPPNIEHTGTFRPPINLAGLAAYVRERGHEPKIYDLEAERIDDVKQIAELLMKDNTPVIGFTCLTPRYPVIANIAAACKNIDSKVIILLGGPHVSGAVESVFDDSSIDYAVVGEGEEPLEDFLDYLEEGRDVTAIPNLAYRLNGRIVVNPRRPFIKDLDSLPFPAWDLLPLSLYDNDEVMFNSHYMGINSARGCAWDCNFCASRVIWNGKVRFRSAENLVKEIKTLVEDYNISEFMFYDDTFTVNRKRALKVCELIKKEGLKIRFYVSLRADTIDREIAAALKEAGCLVVYIGVESGNEDILRSTGKGIKKEQLRSTVSMLKDIGMPVYTSFIIGHPGDTHETIRETIEFAKELDSEQAKFLIAVPYPGTHLYDLALKKGFLGGSHASEFFYYSCYQHVAVNLSAVSDEDLMAYQKKAYEEYDLRKRSLKKK